MPCADMHQQLHDRTHRADMQQLFELKPGDRDCDLLHSLSSCPCSKWLDTLPVVPSSRLNDQAFQDDARIRLWVRKFTTMLRSWHCCGQLVDGDDVAHALGCCKLNSLIINRHDETADAPRQYVSGLGFSSSREDPYIPRTSHTTNRPTARWDFHCHVRPGPGHILGNVSFILPLAPSFVHHSARQASCTAWHQDQETLHEYLLDHDCPGHSFASSPSHPWAALVTPP
jgi:hypothetical protein